MGKLDAVGGNMQVGDLVRWAGKKLTSGEPDDLGMVLGVGRADPDVTGVDYYTVHWFVDNEVYNYSMEEHDIELITKV